MNTEKKPKATKSQRMIRRSKLISFIALFIICVIWVLPLLYMIGASFKSDIDLQLHPEKIFPSSFKEWTIDHYAGFIVREGQVDNMPFWMLNSIWSTALNVFLTVVMDLIVAYALVFFVFKGKKFIQKFMIIWMTIPGVIGTAPSFTIYAAMMKALNITSGPARFAYIYMWLIVPGSTGIFNILLMRNFFATIPKEIIESARSDGASSSSIFFRLIVPLAKSTIMLIILFAFIGSWNNLLWPQMLLGAEDSKWSTITVALAGYTGGSSWGQVGVTMATSVFAMIPIAIVFLFTQRRMIDGLVTTGIKG